MLITEITEKFYYKLKQEYMDYLEHSGEIEKVRPGTIDFVDSRSKETFIKDEIRGFLSGGTFSDSVKEVFLNQDQLIDQIYETCIDYKSNRLGEIWNTTNLWILTQWGVIDRELKDLNTPPKHPDREQQIKEALNSIKKYSEVTRETSSTNDFNNVINSLLYDAKMAHIEGLDMEKFKSPFRARKYICSLNNHEFIARMSSDELNDFTEQLGFEIAVARKKSKGRGSPKINKAKRIKR